MLPRCLISLADIAIGSVQSMAVVVNVLCIFKDVGGDELTAVQGANSLSFGPVYLLRTQCVKMTNLDSPVTFRHW